MHKLFVYGTLRKGCANHHYLHGCEFIDAECEGVIRYWERGVPFPFAKKGKGKIYGELYSVPDNVLKNIDILEGHPSFYRREIQTIKDRNGDEVEGWVYLII